MPIGYFYFWSRDYRSQLTLTQDAQILQIWDNNLVTPLLLRETIHLFTHDPRLFLSFVGCNDVVKNTLCQVYHEVLVTTRWYKYNMHIPVCCVFSAISDAKTLFATTAWSKTWKNRFHHPILSRNKMDQKDSILWFVGDVTILKDSKSGSLLSIFLRSKCIGNDDWPKQCLHANFCLPPKVGLSSACNVTGWYKGACCA